MHAAGDVERFVYCPQNWALARGGAAGDGEASAQGVAAHKRIGEALHEAERHRRDNLQGLRWTFRILSLAGAIALTTVAIAAYDTSTHGLILVSAALVALNGSAGLLTIALLQERKGQKIQQSMGLVPGKVLENDLTETAPLMEDASWGLRGRPDYILQTAAGRTLPIEVKTGRTPTKPHDSHAMQLACYMRLMEANGQPVEYGMIAYPSGIFRIDWDHAMQDRLRGTLARMDEATESGQADRNHNHVNRCRGCARRKVCTQRL